MATHEPRFFNRTTGWSPLGRLFEIYREDFEADHNQYSLDGEEKIPSREALQQISHTFTDILRTSKLSEIEEALSARVAEYLGSASQRPIRIEFSLPSHREMFERWVGLQTSEHSGLPALPVECLGSGYRAIIRLAVLETLLELNPDRESFLVLIEEPEMYLHVHLRRHFYRVLRRLAENGHQVVYTTHSPEFVDLARPQEVIRLHRQVGCCTISRQVSTATMFDFGRMKQKLRRVGNQEIVFANHAVLTEGQDDQGVIEALLLCKGVNCDVLSISVVNCDGATQIKDYVRLCSELGIDFYVIHDRDDEAKEHIKKRNEQLAEAISVANPQNLSLHIYDPTLESVMNTQKEGDNLDHLVGLLEGKDYANISQLYPNLVKPVDEFAATRGLQSIAPSNASLSPQLTHGSWMRC